MRLKTHAINLQTTIRLKGLQENRIYTDTKTGEQYYGSQLMQYGVPLETAGSSNDYYTVMWHFT